MKIGIISDIHSNVRALDVVLNEFDKEKVDKILFLGDIVGIGFNPEDTINMLRRYEDKVIGVTGNHEDYIIKGLPHIVHGDRTMDEDEIANHKWNHLKISNNSLSYLKSLNKEKLIEINGKKIYMVHFPIDENGNYYLTNVDYKEALKNIDSDIYLFGHTHKMLEENDGKYYINPGSLGCPKNTNKACAGILEINDIVIYKQLMLDYNINDAISEILESDMPMKESIIKFFYRA